MRSLLGSRNLHRWRISFGTTPCSYSVRISHIRSYSGSPSLWYCPAVLVQDVSDGRNPLVLEDGRTVAKSLRHQQDIEETQFFSAFGILRYVTNGGKIRAGCQSLRHPSSIGVRIPPLLPKKTRDDLVLFNGDQGDQRPVNEREINMGKTIDRLQKHLPCMLHSPLPTDILSPSISLHLFPSTHPHLPTVRGRVAYMAALWSAPVAWGRLPGLKVRLEVLNKRFIKSDERLIIKWRACSMSTNDKPRSSRTASSLLPSSHESFTSDEGTHDYDSEFSGLFIFEFDEAGRIGKHTIENIEESSNHEKQSPVIAITEWLLRKAKGAPEEKLVPGLAFETLGQMHTTRRRC